MKKANQKTETKAEVLEVEAVEVNLENTIKDQLVKHNLTDAVINELKSRYGGLKLRSLDDKESFLEIKAARKEVRKWGILTEDICEAGRAKAVKEQRLWLSKQKEVLAKIGEVQDPLDAEIKKFEAEQERKELEEKKMRDERWINRQSVLSKLGAIYTEGCFVLNHISYELQLLSEADNEMWEAIILPKYQREFEANEAQRIAEENKRKEELDRMRREREEFEEQQRIFKQQQEEFAKQQRELQMQREESERQERLRKEKEEREERDRLAEQKRLKDAADEKMWRGRLSQLEDIGWNGQFAFDKADDEKPVFTYEQLIILSDGEFENMKRQYNSEIHKRKEEESRKRQEEEKKKQQELLVEGIRIGRESTLGAIGYVHNSDLGIMSEEEWDALFQEKNEEYEKRKHEEWLQLERIKEQQAEQRRQEEIAQSDDKTKFGEIIKQLRSVSIHEMKSPAYRKKVAILKEKLEEIYRL
jgi:hypothetical protein